MKAEIGVIGFQAKECQRWPATLRSQGRGIEQILSFYSPQPCPQLDLGLAASRTVRQISVVQDTRSVVLPDSKPRKLTYQTSQNYPMVYMQLTNWPQTRGSLRIFLDLFPGTVSCSLALCVLHSYDLICPFHLCLLSSARPRSARASPPCTAVQKILPARKLCNMSPSLHVPHPSRVAQHSTACCAMSELFHVFHTVFKIWDQRVVL